jgi:hypothetical protein
MVEDKTIADLESQLGQGNTARVRKSYRVGTEKLAEWWIYNNYTKEA